VLSSYPHHTYADKTLSIKIGINQKMPYCVNFTRPQHSIYNWMFHSMLAMFFSPALAPLNYWITPKHQVVYSKGNFVIKCSEGSNSVWKFGNDLYDKTINGHVVVLKATPAHAGEYYCVTNKVSIKATVEVASRWSYFSIVMGFLVS